MLLPVSADDSNLRLALRFALRLGAVHCVSAFGCDTLERYGKGLHRPTTALPSERLQRKGGMAAGVNARRAQLKTMTAASRGDRDWKRE